MPYGLKDEDFDKIQNEIVKKLYEIPSLDRATFLVGCNRTGCMFCLYGAHLEKGVGRLERMKITHPKQYDFVMRGGKFDSEGMWIPANGGLGFKFVIDWINKNGNLNIKY